MALSAWPALAQDFGNWSYQPGPVGWNGVYAGVNLGTAWGTGNFTDSTGTDSGDFDIDGYLGGGTLGYNWQAGQMVFGVETDFAWSDIDGGVVTGACGITCSTNVDWLWTLRGRVGLDLGGVMPYLTAGLAVGDVTGIADSGPYSASETASGYTIGGGVEARLGGNWTLKGEYLYVDLGDITIPAPAPIDNSVDMHVVRAGLNYRF